MNDYYDKEKPILNSNKYLIKILTYNILAQHLTDKLKYNIPDNKFLEWNIRLNNIINLVKEKNADIVCFQEIDNTKNIYFIELKKYMDNIGYSGVKIIDDNNNKNKNMKLECAVFYKKYINFISKIKHTSRTCNIKLNIKGIDIRIISLHCQSGNNNEEWKKNLVLRDKHINKLIEKNLDNDTNVIICGDFNESPETILDRGNKRFLNNSKYKFKKVIFPPYATVITKESPIHNYSSSQVDHIFYRGNIELLNINEINENEFDYISNGIPNDKYGSDHLPLICEFLIQ